jgi:hypothetical protein
MKISECKEFHNRWEELQKVLGKVLSLAHTEPWLEVEWEYGIVLAKAKEAIDNLSVKSLADDEKVDKR